jgi:hypothetical protein
MQITRSTVQTQKGPVHIAMQQNDESGSPVTWGEHVSDEQYGGGRAA